MNADAGASRRALFGAAGAAVAAAGGLALAGCGSAAVRKPPKPPPAVAARDIELLGGALALERRTVAAYVAGIPLLSRSQRRAARQYMSEELEHTGELISLIRSVGGHPAPRPDSFRLGRPTDAPGVLALLHQLESAQVATYLRLIPQLSPGRVRAAASTILTVDAQHLALLRLQQGLDPVPSAFVTGAQ
ncbi:MAG: ferritin-like domain-containing protein [Solirubrobacteraceae bacterium]